jgi:hypothetical protein
MSTLNPAVKEHLRSVVDTERRRTALYMLRARAFAAVLHVLVAAPYGIVTRDHQWLSAVPIQASYAGVAVALWLLGNFSSRFLMRSGFVIAFFDIPAVTLIMMHTLPQGTSPEVVLIATGPLAAALVVGAGLTLDYLAIALADVSAVIAVGFVAWRSGAPMQEASAALSACTGIGTVTMYLVSRIRALVEQSRRRDLAGKYILGRQIGLGGMAEVFEATYSPAGGFERQVAVKRILPAFARNEEAIELFRREAAVGAMLTHPNIVQVHDFGCDGSAYFLAMELVDGTSLQRILQLLHRTGGAMPIPAFVALAETMCSALDYIHTRTDANGAPLALVHRDVNPPNILISKRGEVKLGDFGVARTTMHESLTRAGEFRGKVRYAAPEQLMHREIDRRSDLFALGVTFYEALTAQRLFLGDSEAQLAVSVAQQKIPYASSVRSDVPAILDGLVAAMLERDVLKRLPSAAAVSRRLATLPAALRDPLVGRMQLAAMVEGVLTHAAAMTPIDAYAAAGIAPPDPQNVETRSAFDPETLPALERDAA